MGRRGSCLKTKKRWVLNLGVAVFAAVVSCGDPEIVVPGVLSVDFYPPNGSVDISVNVQGLIAFSHEVASPTTAADDIDLLCLGTPDAVAGCLDPESSGCPASTAATVAFDSGAMEARVTPTATLQTNTCYAYTVAAGIEAATANVGALPSDRRSAFRTN